MSPFRITVADLPSVRLSRITLPVSLAAALLVALGAPLAWFSMSLGGARTEVRSLAEGAAGQVRRMAEESPGLWTYNTPKVAEYLNLPGTAESFSIRVMDADGRIVFSRDSEDDRTWEQVPQEILGGSMGGKGPRVWEQVAVSHGGRPLAVIVAGLPVGALAVRGLGLLVAFSLAGFLLGAVLGVLPLTVLRRSETRLVDVVERLQQARSELTVLNAELEKRVDEKTASLQDAHGRLQEQQERLRHLAAATFSGQEEERQIIAADLHDSVGQLLTAARINLVSAAALVGRVDAEGGASIAPDAARLAEILEHTARLVDETTERIRQVIRVLGTPLMDQGGLEAALKALVASFQHASCTVEIAAIPSSALDIPPAVRNCAFRVVQEALTNSLRHGRPAHVRIELAECGTDLEVVVADDGVGQSEPVKPGLGLRAMNDRVALLGGGLQIGPGAEGRGTCVKAVIPMSPSRGEESARRGDPDE